MALHSGRLTPSDASFLYLERPEAPMHIGAVAILDGELPFEQYLETVRGKLPRLPRFYERVVPPPLYIGHPTWETASDFDLADHVKLHRLEPPGEEETLRQAASRLVEGTMDRGKPLWELHVLHGLEGGRSALVSKVHHAMVDGVGGNEILTTILDLTPDPTPPATREYEPTGGMGRGERVVEAVLDATRLRIDSWSEYLKGLTEMARSFDVERARNTVGTLGEMLPDLALPPRRLPFNRKCSGRRRLTWTELSFAEARAVRAALGGTVNDVILTALAGAVASYCRLHGEDTRRRTMRVMVPVNVRRAEESGALGNQVSVLPVTVPLDVDDPRQRLRLLRQTTRSLKKARVADGVSLVSTLMGTVPAPFQAAFGSLAISPTPMFNLVCTNVPGPQIPLYAEGLPMRAYYPYVPTGYDLGVNCAIFSYNQRLFFGICGDVGACSDVDVLTEQLAGSFAELKAAAGVGDITAVDVQPPKRKGSGGRRPSRAAAGGDGETMASTAGVSESGAA